MGLKSGVLIIEYTKAHSVGAARLMPNDWVETAI